MAEFERGRESLVADDRRSPAAATIGAAPEAAQRKDGGAADGGGRWANERYPDYEREVRRSIDFVGVGHDFFTRGKAERLIEIAARLGLGAPGARLLDVGCGVGLLHPWLAPARFSITGVDVAADALIEARRRQPTIDYQAYDGERLPFAEASFDLATTICVLHHVPPRRWPHFLAEANRVLKPGGALLAFEHNPWNPLTRLAVSRCEFDRDATLLSAPTLSRLMGETGYVEISREFLFFTPFDNAVARRTEAWLRRAPIGAQYVAIGRKRRRK